MCHLKASSRWALTGTPIQNSLSDIAALYKFLRVEPYSDPRMFKEQLRRLCQRNKEDAVAQVKHLIRCIMLRRSISTVELPERQDLICRLDFSPEEAAIYDKAKSRTLNLLDDAIDSNRSGVSPLNVLPWINSLRMICNLGARAKTPQSNPLGDKWNTRAAQEMFNSLVTAGAAVCQSCNLDLGAVATEVADQVTGSSTNPQLSSCSYLICAPCLEKLTNNGCSCGHRPSHQMMPISTLSSSLSLEEDHVLQSDTVPTKVKALMQDVDDHIGQEKWYVSEDYIHTDQRANGGSVIFSFWSSTLDVVEECLRNRSIGYIRFDGKVSNKQRGIRLKNFKADATVRIALMTISCGSVGYVRPGRFHCEIN